MENMPRCVIHGSASLISYKFEVIKANVIVTCVLGSQPHVLMLVLQACKRSHTPPPHIHTHTSFLRQGVSV